MLDIAGELPRPISVHAFEAFSIGEVYQIASAFGVDEITANEVAENTAVARAHAEVAGLDGTQARHPFDDFSLEDVHTLALAVGFSENGALAKKDEELARRVGILAQAASEFAQAPQEGYARTQISAKIARTLNSLGMPGVEVIQPPESSTDESPSNPGVLSFGQFLKGERERYGLTQPDVIELLAADGSKPLSVAYLSRIEHDQRQGKRLLRDKIQALINDGKFAEAGREKIERAKVIAQILSNKK